MKSVRLNKEIRARIVENVLAKRDGVNPAPEQGSAKELSGDFALKLWKRETPKSIQGLGDNPYIRTRSYISVQIEDGPYIQPNFPPKENGERMWLASADNAFFVPQDDELLVEYQNGKSEVEAQNRKYDKWKEERSVFATEVTDIVASVNTTGQLIEVWPEVEEFIPETIANPSKINLPAITTQSLNDQLKGK